MSLLRVEHRLCSCVFSYQHVRGKEKVCHSEEGGNIFPRWTAVRRIKTLLLLKLVVLVTFQ